MAKGVVREVLASGTGLKGLCLRSLPEAVEGAKVSLGEKEEIGGWKKGDRGERELIVLRCSPLLAFSDLADASPRRTSFCFSFYQHYFRTSHLPGLPPSSVRDSRCVAHTSLPLPLRP